MGAAKPTIIVTGISSSLGKRLSAFLSDYEVIGVDLKPPDAHTSFQFVAMDLSKEESCLELTSLIQSSKAIGVVHLAFLAAHASPDLSDSDRLWHNNVAGTARVMEAITEANRDLHIVEKFIYPSSGLVYGTELSKAAAEDAALSDQTSSEQIPPYVQQLVEADNVVKERAPGLRGCSIFMLRPQALVGAGFQNYAIDAFRGTVQGTSRHAVRLRSKNKKLSYVLPFGDDYLQNRMQFVHVDDLMRLISYILARTEPEAQRLTVLNVAGRSDALTLEQCLAVSKAEIRRVPGKWVAQHMLERRWKAGISTVPPELLPYLIEQNLLDTDKLRKFLGPDYESVIHFTNADAFSDSFRFEAIRSAQPSIVGS
jgi:nucleoside-diphosphate-sugar epimerase